MSARRTAPKQAGTHSPQGEGPPMSARQASRATWEALPVGCVTSTDWSAPGAMAAGDPYLAWAESCRFVGFRLPVGEDHLPEWLPISLELAPDRTVRDLIAASSQHWLHVPRVYLDLPGLRFCTARAARGFFEALGKDPQLHALVLRYELGLPTGAHTGPLRPEARATLVASPPGARSAPKLSGHVLGVIDNGLALGHVDFLDAHGRTRVHAFWRQDATVGPHGRAAATRQPVKLDPRRAGPTPASMGYGHELDRPAIDAAIQAFTRDGIVDEDALYRHLQLWDLMHLAHHGTHVTSLLAGPNVYTNTIGTEDSPPQWSPARDRASRASVIAVQLDWTSVVDTSGGGLNVCILDGLAYILSRCADDAQVVVNISWGSLAGPHDGSTVLDAALAQLVALHQGRLHIVLPAGNAYQGRTHANQTLSPGDSVTLHWRVQPDDHTPSFLEFWAARSQAAGHPVAGLEILVHPPGLPAALPALKLGESGLWPSAQSPQCGLLFPGRSALGAHGACAVLALAPTASSGHAVRTLAPAGSWRITLKNKGRHTVTVDAYIERDDVAVGTRSGGRQSYLQDRHYDTSGGLGGFIDHPDNPTPVRRSGTFNSLATARGSVSVGGIRYFSSSLDPAARYSPRLPDPDAARLERPHIEKVPDRLAVSDDHAALWGVRAAGSRSGSAVRLVGTSAASPQVARDLFNRLR